MWVAYRCSRKEVQRMSDLISRSDSYMNDLIRRKDVLALFPTNDCSDEMIGLYERVLDIPAAYDVEKVVAELEDLQCVNPFLTTTEYEHKAIEIARKGGVE